MQVLVAVTRFGLGLAFMTAMLYMYNDDRIFDKEVRSDCIGHVMKVAVLVSCLAPLVNEIKDPAFVPISLMILAELTLLLHVTTIVYPALPPSKKKSVPGPGRARRKRRVQRKLNTKPVAAEAFRAIQSDKTSAVTRPATVRRRPLSLFKKRRKR